MVVEVEGGGLDVGMQVLWPLGLGGFLGWSFLFALAVFVRLSVPLDRSLDIVSDRLENVEAVVDNGSEWRFLQADELAEGVDGIFDGILKQLLFVLECRFFLRRECVGLGKELLAIGDDSPSSSEDILVEVRTACEFLERFFIHC